jgi:hypothetical protein
VPPWRSRPPSTSRLPRDGVTERELGLEEERSEAGQPAEQSPFLEAQRGEGRESEKQEEMSEEDPHEDTLGATAVKEAVQLLTQQEQRQEQRGEEEERPRVPEFAAWRKCKGSRKQVAAVLKEMAWWYELNQKQTAGDVPLEEADTPEHIKHWLLETAPDDEEEFADPAHPASPLWDRVALQKLRTNGKRRCFLVVRSRRRGHRLLVLKVPAGKMSMEARLEHARRQATYQDDQYGNFIPGMRVRWENWKPFLAGEDLEWVERMSKGGQPILMSERPAPYWRVKGNYGSYLEHREKGAEEMERVKQRGVIEGPLHYRPWVVNPQGGVWQPEKKKWRTIYDLTASGVNGVTLPLECSYDGLDDMLPKQLPGCRQFGWDLKDAFFNSGRWAEHADYLGLQDSENSDFYRYRFALFGGSDCPSHQQRFSKVLTTVLNGAGAERGWPDTKNTAVFMDDGHGVQRGDLCQVEANQQYERMMAFMRDELGVEDSLGKREAPCDIKSYIGFSVDAVEQSVKPEEKKVIKYTEALRVLREAHPDGVVGRRAWASVVGKFQHVAEVVCGGQQLLTEAYLARECFVDESVQDPWGEACKIRVHDAAWEDLQRFAELLPTASRSYYLDGSPEENGFFKGRTSRTHQQMDDTSQAHAGIPVFTTDASGTAGGGHTGELRFYKKYAEEQSAPKKSSNFREFDSGLQALKNFAVRRGWKDRRVLWRTDNTTSMSICNRRGTMAGELKGTSREMTEFCREHGLDLGAMHVAGVLNELADKLSRHQWGFETADWMIAEEVFRWAQSLVANVFTLDGAADILGTNSHMQRFCSVADSYFDKDLAGEHLFANPDFSQLTRYLEYFKRCQARAPERTSGTFVLPVWMWSEYWKHTRGGEVLAYFPEGEEMFTSPEWRNRLAGGQPEGRAHRGPTRWPVVVIHFPPSLDCKSRAEGRGLRSSARADVAAARGGGVRRLRGDQEHDWSLLRSMPPTSVRSLRRWWSGCAGGDASTPFQQRG